MSRLSLIHNRACQLDYHDKISDSLLRRVPAKQYTRLNIEREFETKETVPTYYVLLITGEPGAVMRRSAPTIGSVSWIRISCPLLSEEPALSSQQAMLLIPETETKPRKGFALKFNCLVQENRIHFPFSRFEEIKARLQIYRHSMVKEYLTAQSFHCRLPFGKY